MSLAVLFAQQDADPFRIITEFLESPVLRITAQLILLLFVVVWVALVYWTYTDAGRRGASSVLWGIVAVILPYLGTLIYLIVRPPEFLEESRERELELAVLERELRNNILLCPNCRNLVEKDYVICPYCGTHQRSGKKIGW